jgi:hypothetical protein
MEPEGSLPHSQQPATCPYPEPYQTRPCLPIALRSFETSGTTHPITQRHIQQDFNLQQHRWLKKLNIFATEVSQVPNYITSKVNRQSSRTEGTRWRSWLMHCATSWKVAGSIPGVVIGIFYWHNPFGCTMALGSTQPLTEMSTRNISWGVKAAGA